MRIAERETMNSPFLKTRWGAVPRRAACAAAAVLLATVAVGRCGELEKPAVREPTVREHKERSASASSARPGANLPAGGRPIADGDEPTGAISRLGVPPARTVVFTEEREAAARAFVAKNRPEMNGVLDQLKLSKPPEYRQVICDLFRTSELFTAMRQDDRGRQEIALRIWQTEAKTHLLAAELAANPERSDVLKTELRATVEQLADLQVEQAAYAVKQWEAKVRRAEGQLKKIESGRSAFVDGRVEAILQAVGGAKPESKIVP
jgi:hypothetical protein